MQLKLQDDLPFVTVHLSYGSAQMEVPDVLVDTGSAGTVLAADVVTQVGIVPEPQDRLHVIRGVGGTEVVFSRRVARLAIQGHGCAQFEIEVGSLEYGFDINGILGMDFLMQSGAIIDLQRRELNFAATEADPK
jgi:hypothetical protein